MWLYTNWRRNEEPSGATFQSRGRQPCPVDDPIVNAKGRIHQYNIYQYIAFASDFFNPPGFVRNMSSSLLSLQNYCCTRQPYIRTNASHTRGPGVPNRVLRLCVQTLLFGAQPCHFNCNTCHTNSSIRRCLSKRN